MQTDLNDMIRRTLESLGAKKSSVKKVTQPKYDLKIELLLLPSIEQVKREPKKKKSANRKRGTITL